MACSHCNIPIYIKTVQHTAPMAAPLTAAEALRQKLTDMTGEVYLQLPKRYCPICGELLADK